MPREKNGKEEKSQEKEKKEVRIFFLPPALKFLARGLFFYLKLIRFKRFIYVFFI